MMENMDRKLFLTRVFDYQSKSEWHYQDAIPCVIDFFDDACPPCRLSGPVLRELAGDFQDRVRFYNVDTAVETALAADLGIQNLPTIVLCPVGDKPIVMVGAVNQNKLRSAIEQKLLHVPNSDSSNPAARNC